MKKLVNKIAGLFGSNSKENDIGPMLDTVFDAINLTGTIMPTGHLLDKYPNVWFMYIFGILDFLSQREKLSETKTVAIMVVFLLRNTNLSPSMAGTSMRDIMDCTNTRDGQNLMLLGVQDFRDFIAKKANVPFEGLYQVYESFDEMPRGDK